MQCLRLKFSRGEEVKYISHLSLMRLWERALRRAEVPLAYSEGYSPHPKLSLAAPLPIGMTSETELMDIILNKPYSPYTFICSMAQKLPRGIDIIEVQQLPLGIPSLQSQIRCAEYRVEVKTSKSFEEMQAAIVNLLRMECLPWQHMRDTGLRRYDLRALIEYLWVVGWHSSNFTLGMRLLCGSQGSGRPEQVTLALGLTDYPESIHRTRLLLV